MTRQLILAAAIATGIGSTAVMADCGKHACQAHYGRYTAREAFILFQKHPELIQRFPQIAQQLQTQFGPIQPAAAAPATGPAAATPAVVDAAPATAAGPATAPVQPAGADETPVVAPAQPAAAITPATADPAPAAIASPAPADPASSAQAAPTSDTPPATPAESEVPVVDDVNPESPPADLPLEEPAADA